MTISEKLSETIAQKERIASEVVLQSSRITEINSSIYDILESEELPISKLVNLAGGSLTELTASDLQGLTSIRDYAFYEAPITSIEIPNSVTSIGERAFQYCEALTSIKIPKRVTSIGDYAFSWCSALTSVVISYSLTSIGSRVFQYCDNLTSVTIPNSVTSIENQAFQYCSSLTNLTIPNSVTSIGNNALQIGSSSNKATITFLSTTPPTITSITFNASYLQNIIVPKRCGDIYKSATNWSRFADYIVEASE